MKTALAFDSSGLIENQVLNTILQNDGYNEKNTIIY